MTGTLSTPGTSQMPWEPDTSLLGAAREIAPIIRAHSEEAERERRLSQPVLKALRETGLLRMTTPRSLGGVETDPVTRALVGEEIGRHDSAAAWTLENPLDWAFFCCRLPDEGAEEIYSGGADVLIAAGFEWREPGCSMCLAMNTDRLEPGERCASTTNRNFVGRQGRDGRTHLVSPAMAAAAAVTGRLTDVRDLMQ